MGFLASITRTPERRIAFALLLLCAALYIPFAGNYGLWDPWETHYSEVARQMLMRHNYVSLWWPGSPQDRNEFWSKPVLTFWLMVLGFLVTGLQRAASQFDGEMAVGWTAEWSVRIPFILCGIACAWATWEMTQRAAGRRAGLWAAIALVTSSQFFFVSRQAMTDMAFVAPIAVALAYAGLALILPREEIDAELPRRSAWRTSWPHAPIFYVHLAMVLAVVVPQLIVCSLQAPITFTLGHKAIRMAGVVGMLPWIICFAIYLLVVGPAIRSKRQIYFHIAFLMCGLSTLAKGPAGIGLPVIVILFYLLVQGELSLLLPPQSDAGAHWRVDRATGVLGFAGRLIVRNPLEIGIGVLLFAAVACPWYHAMLINHGSGFWNEFIGDNYVHRAAGRHGDRGSFDYYLLQIGHGMYPWTGFVAAAGLSALAKWKARDLRGRLRLFAVVWFLVIFATMSLVNTKFHHYILPGLPALAILVGLFIDDLFRAPKKGDAAALLFVGVPLLVLTARDLAMFPARLLWLFDYDYVNAPNGGRPWPPGAEYEYGGRLAAFGVVVCAATVLFAATALVRATARPPADGESRWPSRWWLLPGLAPWLVAVMVRGWRRSPATDAEDDVASLSPTATWLLALVPIATVVIAQIWQPAFGTKPEPLANGWILVGAAGALMILLLIARGFTNEKTFWPTQSLLVVGAVACMWTGWGLDRLLTDVSPHWSQKQVIASYYQQRTKEPDGSSKEPLIAWQMYWRGENFYTKNAIYDHRMDQRDKTVFLGDHNAEKLQEYLKSHTGHRVFFIVERTRFEALRGLLPEANRPSLKAVDESNNKIYLAVANN